MNVEMPSHGAFIDLTGGEYGRLTVLGYAGKRGGKSYWNCLCDCGSLRAVRSDSLRDGRSMEGR